MIDIGKYVKLPAFLQFVGMFLAVVMLVAICMHPTGFWGGAFKTVAILAMGAAFTGFIWDKLYVAVIVLALLFAPTMRAQTVHSVSLAWDAYPASTPTNPGFYNLYRASQATDGSCGTLSLFAKVPQVWNADASGAKIAAAPTYVDLAVTAGGAYCYAVSFKYTPSGTPTSIETELSNPPLPVGPVPGLALPSPANFRATAVSR